MLSNSLCSPVVSGSVASLSYYSNWGEKAADGGPWRLHFLWLRPNVAWKVFKSEMSFVISSWGCVHGAVNSGRPGEGGSPHFLLTCLLSLTESLRSHETGFIPFCLALIWCDEAWKQAPVIIKGELIGKFTRIQTGNHVSLFNKGLVQLIRDSLTLITDV